MLGIACFIPTPASAYPYHGRYYPYYYGGHYYRYRYQGHYYRYNYGGHYYRHRIGLSASMGVQGITATGKLSTFAHCAYHHRPAERPARLKRSGLQKLELHFAAGINDCCAGRVPILRLSRCLGRASQLDAVRLHRDITSVHRNRRQFYSERPGMARISTRRANLTERPCSSFQ